MSEYSFGNSWNKKKKRFREKDFGRDPDFNRESYGQPRLDFRDRRSSYKDDDQEKSMSQTIAKPSVILAKPNKHDSDDTAGTPERETPSRPWKEIASSPTTAIAPHLSMSFNRSPQTVVSERKNPFIKSTSDTKFRTVPSNNLVKQSLAQANVNVSKPHDKGTESNRKPSCVKMLDSSLHWVKSGVDLLEDNTGFLVIGVVGMQGVGKSTIMSLLAGQKLDESNPIFAQQTAEIKQRTNHMTTGIDMTVTSERIILLDTQPILSPSLLEQSIHYERKSPSEYPGSLNIEIQSLQITAFLYTICHVVIVVQDWFTDNNIFQFLQTAEMLKPAPVPPSHDGGSTTEREPSELQPVLVFVHNKIDSSLFNIRSIASMNEVMGNMMKYSAMHYKGHFSMSKTNLYPGLQTLFTPDNEVNSFLFPDIHDTDSEEEKCDVTKVSYDPADQQFLSLPHYLGRPSTVLIENNFRKLMLSIPRHSLTHHTLSEKSWFQYGERTWDAIRKSQLISEYNRLLSG